MVTVQDALQRADEARKNLETTGSRWVNTLDAERLVLLAAELRAVRADNERLREALKSAKEWLLVSSDVFEHQRERLTEVHREVRDALAVSAAPEEDV